MAKAKKKRLAWGRDYHGYAWQGLNGGFRRNFANDLTVRRRKPDDSLDDFGRWVRVKMVVVE